jgi:hypothetical protein
MKQRITLVALAVAGMTMLDGCVVAASSSSSGSRGGGTFLLFVPFVLFFLIARLARSGGRRRRVVAEPRSRPAPDVNEQVLRAELSVLADDVMRLEPQVGLHPEARNDFEFALHRYRVARTALEQSTEQVDLVRVQRVADEASLAMARARAVIDDDRGGGGHPDGSGRETPR